MSLSLHPKQAKLSQRYAHHALDVHRYMQVEVTIKLILSWVLALGAIAALVKLVPYHFSQQAKLREIDVKVEETRGRVGKLRAELSRNFDPQQSLNLMEEYSSRLAPHQRIVFWLNQEPNKDNE